MAASVWGRVAGISFGGAAMAATAELGVVHGLGIVEWDTSLASGGEAAWRALLTWLVFLFASAVLAGSAIARRWVRQVRGPRVNVVARVLATLAASAGAAITIPLAWMPARTVAPTLVPGAQLAVIVAAGAGIAIGFVLATAALTSAPIGVGLAVTVAWVWLAALTSAVLAFLADHTPATPRLAMIDAPQVTTRADLWFGPFLMVGVAGMVGLAVATAGRWWGAHRLGTTLAGFAGPALVASAYLIAGLGTPVAARLEPYVASLLAATVGLLASTSVGGLYRRRPASAPRATTALPAVTAVTTRPATPPPAVAGAPRRLAIEAAPQPAYAEREPPVRTSNRTGRTSARAITATPHATTAAKQTVAKQTGTKQTGTKQQTAAKQAATKQTTPKPAAPNQTASKPADRVLVAPGSEEDKRLRQSEREHIGWMQELVNTPPDPNLDRSHH